MSVEFKTLDLVMSPRRNEVVGEDCGKLLSVWLVLTYCYNTRQTASAAPEAAHTSPLPLESWDDVCAPPQPACSLNRSWREAGSRTSRRCSPAVAHRWFRYHLTTDLQSQLLRSCLLFSDQCKVDILFCCCWFGFVCSEVLTSLQLATWLRLSCASTRLLLLLSF